MITETQLIAYGWKNQDDDGDEIDEFFSPGEMVSIYIDSDKDRYEICIYRECVDEEGHLALEGAIEIFKPKELTIEELMMFTQFIETEV